MWSRKQQNRTLINRARFHADVNAERPKEYWNYEALNIVWGYYLLHYLPLETRMIIKLLEKLGEESTAKFLRVTT